MSENHSKGKQKAKLVMRALESAVTKDGHPPTVNESPRRRRKAVPKRLQERANQER
jgi:hypothetical protein